MGFTLYYLNVGVVASAAEWWASVEAYKASLGQSAILWSVLCDAPEYRSNRPLTWYIWAQVGGVNKSALNTLRNTAVPGVGDKRSPHVLSYRSTLEPEAVVATRAFGNRWRFRVNIEFRFFGVGLCATLFSVYPRLLNFFGGQKLPVTELLGPLQWSF